MDPGEARRREEAIAWFAALRAGAMLAEDRAAYDTWRADPFNQAALDSVHQLWGELAVLKELNPRSRPKQPAWRRNAVIAAATIILACVALGVLFVGGGQTIETSVGQQKVQTLSDGSMVAVNVDSRVSYAISDAQRSVKLSAGEAAFSVHADPDTPFVVRVGGYDIRAKGTAFNVRSRGEVIEVSVGEGAVEICSSSARETDGPMMVLRTGQIVRLPATWPGGGCDPPSPRDIAPADVGGWREHIVTYENASVRDVVDDLNRYFERKLVVSRPSLLDMKITIRLEVKDREDAIGTLARLLGLRIERRAVDDVID